MNPIQDFQDALKEFREISREVIPDKKMYGCKGCGNIKKFNNLAEFKEYHGEQGKKKRNSGAYYKKKTDVVYKKRNITQKITVDRKEDPKAWDAQYHWFRYHPDKDVYEPEGHRRGGRCKPSKITEKITVRRTEDPKEYHKQYNWFKRNPDSTKYEPRESVTYSKNITKKITVKYTEDIKEYQRQYHWFKKHPEENICPPKCS